ncbi:MAG: histidine--tRNA ligase [Lachnospiraceae bacterium]|jgi:histidyl-tRNA synthetase|nr:histidine--tRNA ligase [Lachnospiraceae bacterium]
MPLVKQPVTGMKDITPKEMEIREYCIRLIQDTYRSFGFVSMETPCVEHLENLGSKQGGENEKLIFKILKRGEKLRLSEAKEERDITDGGLRYDLTVPLARYYSAHANELPSPFKALQMGNVWRADRPQKGRFRQFMQCDIDILGEASNVAEIELILATTTLIGKLGFTDFTVRINDRKLLKAMAAYSGFPEDSFDSIFIILDKMDKIGIEGVRKEMIENEMDSESVSKYLSLFESIYLGVDCIGELKEKLGAYLPEGTAESLINIITIVEGNSSAKFKMQFDPTLVRGMSYYTGSIFEIGVGEFASSIGGGGRYDEMIGKFTGQKTPACGFSIGFERIIMLLLEKDFEVPATVGKTAYLLEKGISTEKLNEIFGIAKAQRESGKQISILVMKKNKKFQKEQLEEQGFTEIKDFYKDNLSY